ncbi:MAG: glycosyltransferase family 2 protein [Prolixibacteraceae bacterium]|jgi:GT2 family glycosyltransferase|nr:glycosyltransferase family 2 protein [Prolixibacteraceae bacterium]
MDKQGPDKNSIISEGDTIIADFFGYLYCMKLSVVIVNYNVKHFLEQCLHAALKASENIGTEIFVVDNHSVDGSCTMVREKFPQVILIENQQNAGFSKANNQAIRRAKGEYVLLLNPDTVVEEHSFEKICAFMDEHPEAGGLGVKMIDGKGRFLPESKRGLPTPKVAFYKIFGLSALFPRSKEFSRYHLGHLDENQTHEVEILAGAFMLLRKKALDEVGLLDEDYFMYGEDIDLSYRLVLGGYKNYYFAGTTIIHYKGESTKKSSINYVRMFYNAMIIFAQKHFSKGNAKMYRFLIRLAIYFRALLALGSRFVRRVFLPVADALLVYLGYVVLLPYWEKLKFEMGYYPPEYLNIVVPVYILIWIAALLFAGGYRRPVSLKRLISGLVWGTLTILVLYSLVDESLRFSRALILLGSAWAFVALVSYRLVLSRLKLKNFQLDIDLKKRIAIVAKPEEAGRIGSLIGQTKLKTELLGMVSPSGEKFGHDYLGEIGQIEEIVKINTIDELIFSSVDMPSRDIINTMLQLTGLNVDYKIAPPESISIIGSNSIDTAGDLYVLQINSIAKEKNRRYKRMLDVFLSIAFLLCSPFIVWTVGNKAGFFGNIFRVFSGKKSWVGYATCETRNANLPVIRPGVVSPTDIFETALPETKKDELNILYAKDYQPVHDLEYIYKAWTKLGNGYGDFQSP